MSTRSRIGLTLKDGSVMSCYHHWDGYPEWLGVTLKEHYNTYEKIAELLDGGNMSSCYSDSEFDYEKQEFIHGDPKPNYYGGDDEAPRLNKSFDEMAKYARACEEYLYNFVDGEWKAFSIDHRYDQDYEIIDTMVTPVAIPAH